MVKAMKQLALFERKRRSGLDSFVDPFEKRMAKVEKDIERLNSVGMPRWKILEYYNLYGHPPQGNETYG